MRFGMMSAVGALTLFAFMMLMCIVLSKRRRKMDECFLTDEESLLCDGAWTVKQECDALPWDGPCRRVFKTHVH